MASSSSSPTSTSSLSSSSPCAACKLLRRKCTAGCVFAPYFPPDQPAKFAGVHKVFGASNVAKLLNDLPPSHREDAVNSLAYEADARLRDPVYGCVGLISILQQRLRALHHELSLARRELAAAYAAAGAGSLSDHVAAQLLRQDLDPGQHQHQQQHPSPSGSIGGLLVASAFPTARYSHVTPQLLHPAGTGGPSLADPMMGTGAATGAGLMLPPPLPQYQHQQQQHQNFLQIMGAAEHELHLMREGYRAGAQMQQQQHQQQHHQQQQHHHPLPFGVGVSYGFIGHTDSASPPLDHHISSPQQAQELALTHPGLSSLQPFQHGPEPGQQLRRVGSLEHRQALLQLQYRVQGGEGSDADDGGRSSSDGGGGGGGVIGAS